MPGAHALLSPSSASRWLACTPSARLEETFPEKPSGPAAAEGTLAHSLGELLINRKLQRVWALPYVDQLKAIQADELYTPDMFTYMDAYADYVIEQFNAAKAVTPDAVLFTEQKLDMRRYVQDGEGTGDVGIVAEPVLDVVDLKYGKGVRVEAKGNPQMRLYAIGALEANDFLYNIKTVRMTIYQPRLDNISTDEISVVDLRAWAEDYLSPRAAKAFAGEGEFKVGAHCRFCKAAAVCKANAEYNLEVAKYDFADGKLLEDHEVADILTRADAFTKWIAAVEEHALNEAVNNGKRWPGYKLVEGRSNRVITNPDKLLTDLLEFAHYDVEKVTEPAKLLGLTKLEKVLGPSEFDTWAKEYIIKPAGKPALVPEADKRPEYSSADTVASHFD